MNTLKQLLFLSAQGDNVIYFFFGKVGVEMKVSCTILIPDDS